MMDAGFGSFETEMNRGFLQILVLVVLERKMYGYGMIKHLEEMGYAVDESTRYPLLRRLDLVRSIARMVSFALFLLAALVIAGEGLPDVRAFSRGEIVSAITFVVMIAGLGVGWWRELAESGVNIVCRPWVKPPDYWGVYFDTLEKGKAELEAAGITIPFPQRDVHLIGETKSLESGCPSQ